MNILQNWSFEEVWDTDPYTGNQTPNHWYLNWAEPGDSMLSAGAFPDEDPPIIDTVAAVPECVHKLASQLPPDEQFGGENALILDGIATYKVFGHAFSALLWQELELTPGATVTFRVPLQVHAHGDGSYGACAARIWINGYSSQWATFGDGFPDPADPEWVVFTASVLLPPSGHCEVGIDLEGRAEADVSFFIDAVTLEVSAEPEPPEPPEPPVGYVVVVELLPQDATMAEHNEVIERTFAQKRTHLQSADDAARLVAPGLPGSKVDVWAADRWPGDIEAYLRERGVEIIEFYEFADDPDPPEPPDPITPVVPTGIIVGFGTVGDQGQSQNYEILAPQGAAAPSAKFVVDLGAAALLKTKDPDVKIIGRKIDVMYNGQQYNVEWFKYELDPIEQANARMELLRETMMAYSAVDYWEIVNEQKPSTPPEIVNICAFFKRAMTIAESWGKRLALFSFSSGTPEPESWDYALPTGVFQAALERRHAVSLHEYGLWPRDADSHLLRFKALYSRLIPAGLGGIHLYITEYGVPREEWNVTDKMQQLREYDAQLARFPYVAGAHVYVNPWDPPYDQYTSIYPAYREYAVSIKDRING